MIENIGVLLTGVIAATLRSLAGWLENSLKDGKISNHEWGLLGATIFRVGVLTFATYYGLGLDVVASAGSAVVLDLILKALTKKK